ncbi:hypothetical protein TMRH483_02136 [Qipengyuania sp. 483]
MQCRGVSADSIRVRMLPGVGDGLPRSLRLLAMTQDYVIASRRRSNPWRGV